MGIKLFVTGTSGYLGSVLANYLARLPEVDAVTGIDLAPPSTPPAAKVKLLTMDIRSPSVAEAMAGHDYVIHSAFIVQWFAKMPAAVRDDINLNGTRNLARAAVKNGVRGFLHASSVAAYDIAIARSREAVGEDCPLGKGDTPIYYNNGKALAEKIVGETLAGSPVTFSSFRMSYIIGPQNHVTVPVLRKNAALFPGHDPRAQFTHEDDVAEAFSLAIRRNLSGPFNVVTDDYLRLSEAFKILGVKPITLPLWVARAVTFVRWRYFGGPTHPSWVLAATFDCAYSNAKLRAAGWTPRYNSADALRTAL